MIKFFITLIVAAAMLAGVVLIGVDQALFQRPSFFWQTLIFLTFSTAVIFVYLYKADKSGYFLQLYLTTMVLKLLAYCAFCFVMILNNKVSAIGNVVFFMVTYFIFTIIEIAFLYGRISGKKEP